VRFSSSSSSVGGFFESEQARTTFYPYAGAWPGYLMLYSALAAAKPVP